MSTIAMTLSKSDHISPGVLSECLNQFAFVGENSKQSASMGKRGEQTQIAGTREIGRIFAHSGILAGEKSHPTKQRL